MLDIKGKLLSIEQERKQKYINIIDFFDFIKRQDEEVNFSEIAQYLYIELEFYDPQRVQEDFNSVNYWRWYEENGIKLYVVPKSISQPVSETNEVSFFYILEMIMDEIPFDNNGSSSDYIEGKYHDLFLDRERMQELLKIEFSDQNTLNNDDKERVEKETFLRSCQLSKTEEFAKNTDINKSPIGTAERLSYQNLLNEKNSEIARLQAENEQLRAMQEVDNGGKVATLSEYEGELPPKTDADKLADFIELVFNPDLLDNGKIPTYSRLHTKLTAKYRDRKITAKNTIKKYLNQF